MKFSAFGFLIIVSSVSYLASFHSHATSVNHSELDTLKLSQSPYWHKLGHYLAKPLRGSVSTVRQGEFFLSPEGKTNPHAELLATITKLYHPNANIAQTAQCQYPARFTWLESLQGRTAQLDCPELATWREVLDPQGMTLVFPTAFMNNPSSMFGHTLLRVDAKDQTQNKELVAFAINFAAEPEEEDNAALFAFKGMVGSYPGRFTVMPYYRKVREYNDMESRDIWEYQLRLSEPEVQRVLLHLWEMRDAEFDYYFLDENCSYQLLALLELANDQLSLIKDFPLQAIPSDTVEALAKNGLLAEPNYRAAFGTRLLHQADEIDPALFAAAVKAKAGDYPSADEFNESQRAAILEFAYEWLNFELYEQALNRDSTAKHLTQLLVQRSKITLPSPFSAVPEPAVSPEQGHASARLGVGMNSHKSAADSLTFEWRPAYHDLFDSQAGFIPGAQISFLDTQVNIDSHNHMQLDRFYLLDAMALAPSNQVFDSLAWNVRAGFDRKPMAKQQAGRGVIQGGTGKAWGRSDKLHAYTLLSTSLSYGELTDHQLTLGLGSEAGVLYQVADNHRVGIQGQYLVLIDSPAEQDALATASWHWSFNRHWAVRSQAQYQHWHSEDVSAKLTTYFYY